MRKIAAAVIVAGVLGAGVVFVYMFDPVRCSFYPRCLFNSLTGLYCPGCGSARALHALVHGNIRGALGFNPLIAVGGPVAGFAWVADRLRRGEGKFEWARRYAVWGVLGVVLLFWVLRNIPVFPFNLLAP